jgi:hypothetical protein
VTDIDGLYMTITLNPGGNSVDGLDTGSDLEGDIFKNFLPFLLLAFHPLFPY